MHYLHFCQKCFYLFPKISVIVYYYTEKQKYLIKNKISFTAQTVFKTFPISLLHYRQFQLFLSLSAAHLIAVSHCNSRSSRRNNSHTYFPPPPISRSTFSSSFARSLYPARVYRYGRSFYFALNSPLHWQLRATQLSFTGVRAGAENLA